MSMEISLRLGEHGWSDLNLWLGDKHQDFCITHIFNSPLTEMVDALLSLQRGDEEAAFTLHEEPGQHVWTMTRIQQEQHLLLVEIRSYEDNFEISKPVFEVTEFRIARDFFIESFLLEFDKIASQLRYPQFSKNRDSEDFPLGSLRELRSAKLKRANKTRMMNSLPAPSRSLHDNFKPYPEVGALSA